MDDTIDEMLIEVRASTEGFTSDIAAMRDGAQSLLGDGFGKAGSQLERSLVSAISKGNLGFEDLLKTASKVLDQIASQALQLGLDQIFGSTSSGGGGAGTAGGLSSIFGGLVGSIFGLPGRATGGPVSAGNGYLVGERGPELFVPTSAGRVEALNTDGAASRDVRVAINLSQPRGNSAPVALQRSSRQVASAIRTALAQ